MCTIVTVWVINGTDQQVNQLDPRCCGADGSLRDQQFIDVMLFCQPESKFVHFLSLRPDVSQEQL